MDSHPSYPDLFYEFCRPTYPLGIPSNACRINSHRLRTLKTTKVSNPHSFSHNSWGVFRLTDPPGRQTIANCSERGLFHPHPIPGDEIYRDCWRGPSDGHVREMPDAN